MLSDSDGLCFGVDLSETNQRANCRGQSFTANQQRSTITATPPGRCSQDANPFKTPKSSVFVDMNLSAMPDSNREGGEHDESDEGGEG